MSEGVYVRIQGHNIYHTMFMPIVPRKGDILWLSSLTRGAYDISEVIVSRVEWSMEQQSGLIGAWVKVRRMPARLRENVPGDEGPRHGLPQGEAPRAVVRDMRQGGPGEVSRRVHLAAFRHLAGATGDTSVTDLHTIPEVALRLRVSR